MDHDIKGRIIVVFDDGAMKKLKYNLVNVEANKKGGLHIHEGKSCDTDEEVLGHWWRSKKFPEDPWNPKMYVSKKNGKAKGNFKITSGWPKWLNDGRAVVVHASDGTRIGCGILSNAKKINCFRKKR